MKASESIVNIAKALCAFQSTVEAIRKDKANPFLKNKYADISNILEEIREPLATNGLCFVQFPAQNSSLCTRILHTSGEWLEDEFSISPLKNDPQAMGSAITYMRRYALVAILGLSTEDDDAQAASKSAKQSKQEQQQAASQPVATPNTQTPPPASDEDILIACQELKEAPSMQDLQKTWARWKPLQSCTEVQQAKDSRKNELSNVA